VLLRGLALLTITFALLSCATSESSPPPLSGRLLVHAVLKLENPDAADALGEQSMTHRLYLVDLSQRRILAEATLGTYVILSYSEESGTVWVAQRTEKPANGTRLREFGLDDFRTTFDVTLPLGLGIPVDNFGQFLANAGMAVLGPRELVLTANQRDSVGSDVLKISITATDQVTIEELGVARHDIVDYVKGDGGVPLVLLESGKTLRLERSGSRTVLKEEAGMTPIVLDTIPTDAIWHAADAGSQHATVAISMGGMLFRRDWKENKTFNLATDAVYPQDLSVDRSGRCAAIRYQSDPGTEKCSLMVVDLDRWKEVYSGDLAGAGAVLQWSPTQTLIANGNRIALLDLANLEHPQSLELLQLSGPPVERVLKMVPVHP